MTRFVAGKTGLATRWRTGCALGLVLAAAPGACAYADGNAAAPAEASSAAPGYLFATRLAKLAHYDEEVDIQALAQAFDMPALLPKIDQPGAMVWNGPFSRVNARTTGHYRPKHSSLGIEGIDIIWQPSQGGFFRELAVALRAGHCPDKSTLQTVLGSTPHELPMRPTDGGTGPGSMTTIYSVPQSQGSPVNVMYNHGDTCHLHVVRQSD